MQSRGGGPTGPLIEIDHVSKRFEIRQERQRSIQESMIRLLRGQRRARRYFWPVHDVSLSIYPGNSLGLIGSNGSGKSTLLKLIAGILDPSEGRITTRCRIASMLELGTGFHHELTGRQNIFLNGSMYGLSQQEMRRRFDAIVDFAELGDFIDTPIKHYSSGMYVRLGFAVAINTDPDVLLVDEVLAVGDTAFQHKCMDKVYEFQAKGGTLLLVSHDLATIEAICKQAVWLADGRMQACGKPVDVVMAYLNRVAQKEEAVEQEQARVKLDQAQRWGTRKVEVTGVETCDTNGQCCSIFTTGSSMNIRIHYRAGSKIPEPIFGLAIHRQDGVHICGPNTDFGNLSLAEIEGEGTVTYRIPALPLLEGHYQVSVSCHNRSDTEMYDYYDRAFSFRVYPGQTRERYGLLTLNGAWEIESPTAYARLDEEWPAAVQNSAT